MTSTVYRWSINLFVAACFILLALLLLNNQLLELSLFNQDFIANFKTIFLSIILEALPFVLLGVLVSAILQSFVSEQTIRRMIPNNPLLGILFACVMGIIFPLCECGMIPVIRRLIRKGMPVYIAVVFILVGPILNPVVFASTYMAFRSRPEMAYSRMGLAFVVALVLGLLLVRFLRSDPLRVDSRQRVNHEHHHLHQREHDNSYSKKLKNKLGSLMGHASDEFFEMGKYLIFGAMLAALIQTLVVRESLLAIGQGPIGSHLFMMGFAFVLSLCSTSDAFVASSFTTTFASGSLLTFLVFGPMIDIKGVLMLLTVFKKRFVLKLCLLVAVIVLLGSLIFERLIFI